MDNDIGQGSETGAKPVCVGFNPFLAVPFCTLEYSLHTEILNIYFAPKFLGESHVVNSHAV